MQNAQQLHRFYLLGISRNSITEQGDLPISAPLQEMTDFYATVIQGLTIQARDGASTEQLHKVVEHAMKAWTLF